MRFRVRRVCFGSLIVTLVVTALVYYNLQEHPPPSSNSRFRLGPRRNEFLPRGDKVEDQVYNDDENDDGVIDIKRGPVPADIDFDLPSLAIVRTPEDQRTRDDGYRKYAFNQLVSDRIGYHRPIPDSRNELCQSEKYPPPSQLPQVSIVICFYNEAWSALLRTIYSVLDRSPPELIHEFIVVDDFSDHEQLQEPLSQHIAKNLPKVKLVRTAAREGLIRARNYGAKHATGEVLLFLDSHCEVNTGWLEPLLYHIHQDQHSVAVPIIDIINADTMAYEPSPLVRGGFNWGLHFRWDDIPASFYKSKEDLIKPVRTPTMAGGLFAMNRQYFMDLGMYDAGMDVWGGENLEISFRVWQCGGRMDLIPCSRIGHIFRKRRPYGSKDAGDSMTRNSLRVANVWMDEFKEYYYKTRQDARTKPYGDISDRLELRKSLKCESFKWYLENVYPEQTLPTDKVHGGLPKGESARKSHQRPKTLHQGHLVHVATGLCVVGDQSPADKRSMLRLAKCDYFNKDQAWSVSVLNEFRLADLLCLDGSNTNVGRSYPRLMKCTEEGSTQAWRWMGKIKQMLLNTGSGQCLSLTGAEPGAFIATDICDEEDSGMLFHLKVSGDKIGNAIL